MYITRSFMIGGKTVFKCIFWKWDGGRGLDRSG
jgi:hypothetical protein